MNARLAVWGTLAAFLPVAFGQGREIGVSWVFNQIEGTTLSVEIVSQVERKSHWSQETVRIGYEKGARDGKGGGGFSLEPLISPPPVDNDRYALKCTDGMLRITLDRAGAEVATVDLRAIAPHTVTEAPTRKRELIEPRAPVLSLKVFRRSIDSKFAREDLPFESYTDGAHFIKGTTLCISSGLSLSLDPADGTLQDFAIGYEQRREEGDIFVPFLELPPLANDFYNAEYSDGIVKVTALKAQREVISLNLDALAPSAIVYRDDHDGSYPKSENDYNKQIEEVRGWAAREIGAALPDPAGETER